MVSHSTLRPSALLSMLVALLLSVAFVAASVDGNVVVDNGAMRQRRVRSPGAQPTGIARRAVNYMAVRPRANGGDEHKPRASPSKSFHGEQPTPKPPRPTGKPHGPKGTHGPSKPHGPGSKSHGPKTRRPDVGGDHHPSKTNVPFEPHGPYYTPSTKPHGQKSASRSGVYHLAVATEAPKAHHY